MKTKLLAFIFVAACSFSFAQVKLADKFFKNYGYIKAIELYESAFKKGDNSLHVLTRLGDAYYNNSNSEKAAYWYGEALKEHKNIDAEYLYKYIQSLRSIGNYAEADKWFKELSAAQQGDSRLKGYNPDEVDLYDKLTSKSEVVVTVEDLDINSELSDFGAYIFDDQLYFASARNNEGKVYSWNKEPFLDLYQISAKEKDGAVTYGDEVLELSSDAINSEYHEASIAITNDGKTLYFTRDNVNKRKRLKYDNEGTTHLKLYKASLINDEWTNVVELPFNDDVFSTGHPALNPDNTKLFFVSDREGGLGQSDIYSVTINNDGSYGEPENLGENVNTEGREMFPYVSNDNTLYFSSDGHLNLGLLDIFKSNILKDLREAPQNLGAPYNSGYDDFAFFTNSNAQSGYFSSNRPNGKGSDDIYSFNTRQCKQTISGVAKDSKTDIVLTGVNVRLIDETGKVIEELFSEDGMYTFNIDCNTTYTIVGNKVDYKDDLQTITTLFDDQKDNIVDLSLEPLIIDYQIVINPIFFDFDKSSIRTDAQYELENIVDVMRKHPEMIIKIESHTDSRGRDKYNLKLSDKRAKATRNYIISRGIAPKRIESAIGYGETQLLNKCANRVKCTEEEHQINRRSYFYIVNN